MSEVETARVIDFRRTWWGHNLSVRGTGDGTLAGHCWVTPGPREGDLVTWATEYGRAIAMVTAARWTINVDDMFEIKLRVVERRGKGDEVLWAES